MAMKKFAVNTIKHRCFYFFLLLTNRYVIKCKCHFLSNKIKLDFYTRYWFITITPSCETFSCTFSLFIFNNDILSLFFLLICLFSYYTVFCFGLIAHFVTSWRDYRNWQIFCRKTTLVNTSYTSANTNKSVCEKSQSLD